MINKELFEPYQGFIRGNMFKNLFDQFGKIYDIKPLNEQAELLTYIDIYNFACIDIKLYLDINEDDQEMIDLYNIYCSELKKYMMEYENKYGALTENSLFMKDKWNWLNPFPWEV